MVDRRFRDAAWGQPPASATTARTPERPSDGGEVPASPSIASSGPEIDKSGPSGAVHPPAIDARDGWGRPLANVGTTNAVPAPVSAGVPERDTKGRFLTGNSGGGRPRGSKNRLTTGFLDKLAAHFSEHSDEAFDRLLKDSPGEYLRLIAALIPRSLILQQETMPDFESWDEVTEFLEKAQRKRQVEIALDEMKKY